MKFSLKLVTSTLLLFTVAALTASGAQARLSGHLPAPQPHYQQYQRATGAAAEDLDQGLRSHVLNADDERDNEGEESVPARYFTTGEEYDNDPKQAVKFEDTTRNTGHGGGIWRGQ